jgi:hypothetical protein
LVLVAFVSLFANALVLFFVARPARAFLLLCVYVASVMSLISASAAAGSDTLFATAMTLIILGPACLAGIEYYWHAVALRQGPVLVRIVPAAEIDSGISAGSQATRDSPRFFGTRELEELRNELEIAIFHRKDRIALLTKLSYFAAALQAVLAALEGAWFDLSISLVLIALAYTIRAHESRVFAVVYSLFGVLIAADVVHRSINRSDDRTSLGLPVLIITLGVGLTAACFSLARFRRLRERIPLEPAAHLQDPDENCGAIRFRAKRFGLRWRQPPLSKRAAQTGPRRLPGSPIPRTMPRSDLPTP